MSKTYSAGIVTAYGAAKRAGYQGTYEDFCRQQAGYAESAATVEQAKNTAVSAASTATTKAGEAATAATAAQTAKTQTEQSASQALTDIATARSGAISAVQTEGQTQTANARSQAQAAATSATTASTKASEASASATSAGQSATNAAASATNAASSASAAQAVLESIPKDYSDLSRDVDDLKADLGALDSLTSAITAKLELSSSPNMWNEADKTIGFVGANGSRNSTNTSYQTLLHPIPVNAGDVVRFYGNTNAAAVQVNSINARFICAYDSEGNAVTASGSTADTRTYTVPSGIVSIIPSILSSQKIVMVTINEEVTTYEPYSEPYYVATLDFLPKSVLESIRPVVNIKATDTEAEIISKMVNAYNTKNCDVVFERAVYNFGTAIATVKTDYGLSGNNEIPIGNGCRYFFNGAVLNAVMDLGTLGVDFYVNLLGAQNAPSDFELHDGILKATDTRYVVHDDAGGKKGTYKHLYQNMQVIYTTNLRTEAIRKAVGGGTGQSGVVEMVGCKFVTNGTDSAVSYHGNATDYAGSEFLLNVRNCWISNSLRAGELSANQSARLLYTGNSSGSNLQTYARWDVTSFLNEVRS